MAEVDPFADPTDATDGDPFSQPAGGGGDYPKPDTDLIGELIMLTPSVIDIVADTYAKEPGKTKKRLSATTVVLTGDLAGNQYEDMYWSQTGVVKSGETALRKNQKMILGRLQRVPIKDDVKSGKFAAGDSAAIEKALGNPKTARNTNYAIVLLPFTEEDAAVARAYLAKN